MQEHPHHVVPLLSLPPPPLTFSTSYLCPLSHPFIPARGLADRKTLSPSPAAGFKSGGRPCIYVSKVRLPCRMLSFSGWWLRGERDDSTGPRGWCVKRYGKTRINRGPGILPDWMWAKLSVHPMGEIKDQLWGGNQARPLALFLRRVTKKVWAEEQSAPVSAFVLFLVICVPFEETN